MWVCSCGGVTCCQHACPVRTARPGLSVSARWRRRQASLVRSCMFKPHNGIYLPSVCMNKQSAAPEHFTADRTAGSTACLHGRGIVRIRTSASLTCLLFGRGGGSWVALCARCLLSDVFYFSFTTPNPLLFVPPRCRTSAFAVLIVAAAVLRLRTVSPTGPVISRYGCRYHRINVFLLSVAAFFKHAGYF